MYMSMGVMSLDALLYEVVGVAMRHQGVLLYFTYSKCGDCGNMTQEIYHNNGGVHPIIEVDIEDHPELVSLFRVTTVPTMIRLCGSGAVVSISDNANLRDSIIEMIKGVR